jgi:hypothetical protein
MKHLKKFEHSSYYNVTFYKIFYGEDFVNLASVLYKICKSEKKADETLEMFKKNNNSNYIYAVTTIRDDKIRYNGWMRGDKDSLEWLTTQDYINGGTLTATPEEINNYYFKQNVKNYNI